MGDKYSNLCKNILSEVIEQGNLHMIVNNASKRTEEETIEEYHKKTCWSDFNISIPLLFNFYHFLELRIKGLLILKGEKPKGHDIVILFEDVKSKFPEEKVLLDTINIYLNKNKIDPYLKDFLEQNNFDINEFYDFLKYPTPKSFTKVRNYQKLKYKEEKALTCFKKMIDHIEKINKKYYSILSKD